MEQEAARETPAAAGTAPIVVDLGKVKRKNARALRQGDGPLLDEVEQVVDAVRESLGDEAEGAKILPVVVLYRVRPKKKRKAWGW